MFGRRKTDKPDTVVKFDKLHDENGDARRPDNQPAADPEDSAAGNPPEQDLPEADQLDQIIQQTKTEFFKRTKPVAILIMPRQEASNSVQSTLEEVLMKNGSEFGTHDKRDLVTVALNEILFEARKQAPEGEHSAKAAIKQRSTIDKAKEAVHAILLERIDIGKVLEMQRGELAGQINEVVEEILEDEHIQLNQMEQRDLVTVLLNDMLGLGPLEPLLSDEAVTDIMVNGAKQIYVERGGKLELTDITFRDDAHVMNIAGRIVSRIGRRIDESTPLVDARLEDGSRVNIIIPPLAIDGPSISIRKFSEKKITLDIMEKQRNISPAMGKVMRIASRCRLNILISGGTGSGKTTMLNALSHMIDVGERICTIEDAAELQLQQPHVVRLETRPPNLEGRGEITMRDLLKNTLRMRPDRIILGEIRGSEALDMLQAMNTGHDGSMCTIHANNPREALTRLENMVAMAGVKLPHEAVRAQIANAVHMVVQVSRMRDGVRRVSKVTEIVGMEGEIVTTQDLFHYEFTGEDADGKLTGRFISSGLRPVFMTRAQYYGLERALMQAMATETEE